jgi:hypothetical protein
MYKEFWVLTRRRYLVRYRRFGTTCVSHQGLNMNRRNKEDHIETLMMGHTGSPETSVSDQVTTPDTNPENLYPSRQPRWKTSIVCLHIRSCFHGTANKTAVKTKFYRPSVSQNSFPNHTPTASLPTITSPDNKQIVSTSLSRAVTPFSELWRLVARSDPLQLSFQPLSFRHNCLRDVKHKAWRHTQICVLNATGCTTRSCG